MAEKDSGHILPGFAKKKGTNYQGMVYIQNTKKKKESLKAAGIKIQTRRFQDDIGLSNLQCYRIS